MMYNEDWESIEKVFDSAAIKPGKVPNPAKLVKIRWYLGITKLVDYAKVLRLTAHFFEQHMIVNRTIHEAIERY